MIAFVHLSDIHFTTNSGDRFDVDYDLRNELLIDIRDNLKTYIPEVNGILVCGDIAFSGKFDEYTFANDFLNQVCEVLSLSKSMIYCVPGNHDIDQGIPKESTATKLLQNHLEAQTNINAFDDCLGRICRDQQSAKALFEPIETYNSNFAGKYGCALSENLNTVHIMPISETYKLCIVGINSTLISNSDDHRNPSEERLMKLGQLQIPLRAKDIINLTLCHHPPECWFDPEMKLQQKMNNRVHIQLYGHKHLQTIKKVDNSLIVGSGATHPSRWESEWFPRYNWITIELCSTGDREYIEVKIYPRVLDETESRFEKDPQLKADDFFSYTLEVGNSTDSLNVPASLEVVEMSQLPLDISKKDFVYSFMNLSYFRRKQIVADFHLDDPSDDGYKHVELLDEYIKRAQASNCYDALLNSIRGK